MQTLGLGDGTQELMDTAVQYQAKATILQNDINNHLILLRQTVTEVLQANMNETIHQTTVNSNRILTIFSEMSGRMDKLVHDDCYEDLSDLFDGIVKMTGFKIGNVLTDHDKNVTIALADTDEVIKKYDVISTSVQRIVHRAFIKSNIFKNPKLVSEKFVQMFEMSSAEWEVIKPEIASTVLELRNKFNRMLVNLGGSFGGMQKSFDMSVNLFENDAIIVCEDYSRDAKSRMFSGTMVRGKFRFFDPEIYLPKFD